MPSLAEIDLALTNARSVAPLDRGPAWFAYVDSLLEQRARRASALTPDFSSQEQR